MPHNSGASPSIPADLRMAVVGAGALGSALCRLLAQAGHPAVLVIDPDLLEPHNVPLSPLFQAAVLAGPAIGRSKALLAIEYAQQQVVPLPWRSQKCEIADVALGDLREVDVILSCTDSTLARLETTLAARILGLPVVDGGLQPQGSTQGRVTWFSPLPVAACSLCGLSAQRRADILAYAVSASLGCTLPPQFSSMSGLPSTAHAVAEAMLQVLATHLSQPDSASFTQKIDSVANNGLLGAPFHLTPSPTCPWHDLGNAGRLVEMLPGETFQRALQRLAPESPAMSLEFPWPICLRARCSACNAECEPLCRTAYARRKGHCPHCSAAGTLDPLQSLGALWPGHPLATTTPQALNLPTRQLYYLRPLLRLE